MKCLIRTTPWIKVRYRWAKELASLLPNGELVESDGGPGLYTLLRALEAQGDDDAWHFEGDVIITSNFEAKAREHQEQAPGSLIQGFDGFVRTMPHVGWSNTPPIPWNRTDRPFLGAQCFYVPAGMAPAILAFGREWEPPMDDDHLRFDPGWQAADIEGRRNWYRENSFEQLIRAWVERLGVPYWIAIPSLAQHRRGKSTLTAQRKWRGSPTFTP